ncbi:MAG: hypothetical protein ACI9JL_001405 [Paracoccaceae bacterium]|jgi:hypothetical protein
MPKLTDTQLVILSTAAKRDGGAVLPLAKSLKANEASATKAVKSLIKRSLIDEQPAARGDKAWRAGENGSRLTLIITGAGLKSIGAAAAKTLPIKRKARNRRPAPGRQTGTETSLTSIRQGTKQAVLIDLLRRKNGATIDEIVDAIGWQPHSIRGAISGTLRKKLELTVESDIIEDRGRVYSIAEHG